MGLHGVPLDLLKMKGLSCLLVLRFACLGLAVDKVDYSGYQVLRVEINNEQDAESLKNLEEEGLFDFWTEIRMGKHVDIMASPDSIGSLDMWLETNGLTSAVMIQDVAPLMELEKMNVGNNVGEKLGHSMDWTSYHPLEEMYGWFDYLETTFDFVETESIGQTFEGQEMVVMKVCRGGCGNKPAMWIDSGIHAREWISPATGTWMLHELVENDAAHPEFTEKLDWDFHWSETGASGDSCSQTYYGPEPFSEVEAKNVRDFVSAHKDQIKFYQTLHSYSQLILMPWGYTYENAPGYDAMFDLGNRGNDALYNVHGKFYEVGCIPCVLYTAAGTSLDWALGVAGIPYVYSIELRDTGSYGFLLPADQIIPTAEEAWAWHEVAARQIIEEFGEGM